MSWPLRAAGGRLEAFPTYSLVQPDPQDIQPAQGSKYLFRVHVKLFGTWDLCLQLSPCLGGLQLVRVSAVAPDAFAIPM